MVFLRRARQGATHSHTQRNLIIDVSLVKTLSRSLLLPIPLQNRHTNSNWPVFR